jgi:MFS family permease
MPRGLIDPYAALRSSNYRRFALGFLLSSAGLQMLAVAVGWEIYERTKDPLALGWVGVARALPVILFALPAGQIIDRFDRRWVLVITQVCMGLGAGALAVASHVGDAPIVLMYALLSLMGCARAFNGPSRATLLPLIVPTGAFPNAVAWNSSVFQLSAVVGPIVAGLLMAQLGTAWEVYAICSACCLVFAISAMGLQPREAPRASGPLSVASVFAGASFIWREKPILGALTLDLFAVLLGGATALLPIYAKDILHVGPEGLGLLRAAPFIGAFVMSIVLTRLPPFRRTGQVLLWSVAGFGVCIVIFGLSTVFWLSLVALFMSGVLDTVSVVIRHVLVQLRTPNELRGRVSSVNSVFIESSNELGAFESGLVASWFSVVSFGAMVSAVSGGIGTIIVVAAVAAGIPKLRTLGELHDRDAEQDPERAPVDDPATAAGTPPGSALPPAAEEEAAADADAASAASKATTS